MQEYIQTPEGLYDRKVGGRALYSHVVIARPGDLIFVSGQLSRDAEGNIVGIGDMGSQIRQVLSNISAALKAAGAGMDDVVQTTTYTTDIAKYFENVDVRSEFFAEVLPTSTAVEVSRLSNPQFLVEIEVIAVKSK